MSAEEPGNEIDTFCLDVIKCPFCGEIIGDADYDQEDDTAECPECGRVCDLEIEYSVSYTTTKPDWLRKWRAYNRTQIALSNQRRSREEQKEAP
jgi:transcription elongation factor Elf1